MNNIIWASGFDPSSTQLRTYGCGSNNNCNSIFELDMDDANILLASLSRGGCSNGWYGFYRSNLGRVCLRLPDPVGDENTRYTAKYLQYLLTHANGSHRAYPNGSIPRD